MASGLPEWFKKKAPNTEVFEYMKEKTKGLKLHTVCESAKCPNQGECFTHNTATVMILGDVCTRNCSFCAVNNGCPTMPDENEPNNVAVFVKELGLKYVVITSVTRDDLPDGGAGHFAKTIEKVRGINSGISIEILIPDFKGDIDALSKVVKARPEVINHNIETVERLYPIVRPQAIYYRSLNVFKNVKHMDKNIITKSGFMVGLGESKAEVIKAMEDLYNSQCDMITIGQYLRPSPNHLPVVEYIHPEVFKEYREIGLRIGFKNVFSAPLVRSSYHAGETFHSIQ
jgi:lipoic acid synthetase